MAKLGGLGYHAVMHLRSPLALALALAGACTDDPADDDDTGGMCLLDNASLMRGDLILWGPFGVEFDQFCSAGYDIAEDHARWVAKAWGTEPIEFDYGVFATREHECWPCHSTAGACVVNGIVASTEVPHRHEIAHAVRAGSCHAVIEEGWAMLYGDHFEDAETDIRVVVADTKFSAEYYPIAARFVAFLLETRGTEQLRALCSASGRSPEDFEAGILATYDMTFEELATEFDAYPEYWLSELRQDQACEGDDVLLAPTEWDFFMECGAPGIEGKPGGFLQTQRLVELPEDGYRFSFESASDVNVHIEIRNCARQGAASLYFGYAMFHLEAGTPFSPSMFNRPPAGKTVLRVRLVDATQATTVHVNAYD